jgi:hypothetical protein
MQYEMLIYTYNIISVLRVCSMYKTHIEKVLGLTVGSVFQSVYPFERVISQSMDKTSITFGTRGTLNVAGFI